MFKLLQRLALVAPFAVSGAICAQGTSTLTYDVSFVKPHAPGDGSMSWGAPRGEFKTVNIGLKSIITSAWGLRPDQIAGEPAWVDDEHWDITAKMSDADATTLRALSKADIQHMDQALLADRFHLKAHLETRQGPVFNLLPAKRGVKLQILPTVEEGNKQNGNQVPSGGMMGHPTDDGGFELVAHRVGTEMLIGNIAVNLGQTIIDKTGISPDARFDFKLKFAPDRGPASFVQTDAPPIREAVEQQLGLYLESTRGPVQVIVVDHVERPTPN